MSGYCGVCGANLGQIATLAMHPEIGDDVLCGPTGKRAHVVGSLADVVRPDPKPTTAAREALAALTRALEYHEEMESTPCEVHSVEGWVDVMDLAVAIGRALDA